MADGFISAAMRDGALNYVVAVGGLGVVFSYGCSSIGLRRVATVGRENSGLVEYLARRHNPRMGHLSDDSAGVVLIRPNRPYVGRVSVLLLGVLGAAVAFGMGFGSDDPGFYSRIARSVWPLGIAIAAVSLVRFGRLLVSDTAYHA